MITVLANLYFWPATVWVVICFAAVLSKGPSYKHPDDTYAVLIPFLVWLAAGLYLFGLF